MTVGVEIDETGIEIEIEIDERKGAEKLELNRVD